MTTLAINLTLLEFIVLPLVAFIFGFAIYFFIKSRKTLRDMLEASGLNYFPVSRKQKNSAPQASTAEGKLAKKRLDAPLVAASVSKKHAGPGDDRAVHELKRTLTHQQDLLSRYIEQVEELETTGKDDNKKMNGDLQKEILRLHDLVEKKDAEIEDLYRQANAARKMAARIEEAYQEFEQLQSKMQLLEKQAGRANSLAIELEDARNAYEVIHKELARKQEKLENVMEDNRNLREEMNLLEDKLSEANLQRQQLQKKVQFLTDLNNDMQDISEANKKLQTELRRIGELESMLNMMAEERDYLLRKKLEK